MCSQLATLKGPFIFYEVGGAGGISGGGGSRKKRLKRGAIPKNRGKGGGHAKYFSSCRVDMIFYFNYHVSFEREFTPKK